MACDYCDSEGKRYRLRTAYKDCRISYCPVCGTSFAITKSIELIGKAVDDSFEMLGFTEDVIETVCLDGEILRKEIPCLSLNNFYDVDISKEVAMLNKLDNKEEGA